MDTASTEARSGTVSGREGQGWSASLRLRFERRGERTVATVREHEGPLVVQRPFHPEPGVCHAYVLHPPGGIVGGDRLSLEARAEPGARAVLTTPAATKLYRSGSDVAVVSQRLSVAAGASIEWLPQETIAFEGARASVATRAEVEDGGVFIGWEITCLGRPAAGERFERGRLRQSFELVRAGRPVLVERAVFEGGAPSLRAKWGLGGAAVTGTLACVGAPATGVVDAIRARVQTEAGLFAVTSVDGAVVCRYLGPSAEEARAAFIQAWSLLREAALGIPALPPRIWAT